MRNHAGQNQLTAGAGQGAIYKSALYFDFTLFHITLWAYINNPTGMSNVSDYSLPQAEPSIDPNSLVHLQQLLETIGSIWGKYNQLLTDTTDIDNR